MANKVVTKYYQGSTEVSKEEYNNDINSFSNTVTTETDSWGRERITKEGPSQGLFPSRTYTDSGFKEDESESLEVLGAMASGVFAPIVLAGAVVYGTGKLVYHIATTKKRQREEAERREWQKEYAKTSFAENVERILSSYNQKLSKYKELLELGVLTESEYDAYVKEFIRLSNQEIDEEKKHLEKRLKSLEK